MDPHRLGAGGDLRQRPARARTPPPPPGLTAPARRRTTRRRRAPGRARWSRNRATRTRPPSTAANASNAGAASAVSATPDHVVLGDDRVDGAVERSGRDLVHDLHAERDRDGGGPVRRAREQPVVEPAAVADAVDTNGRTRPPGPRSDRARRASSTRPSVGSLDPNDVSVIDDPGVQTTGTMSPSSIRGSATVVPRERRRSISGAVSTSLPNDQKANTVAAPIASSSPRSRSAIASLRAARSAPGSASRSARTARRSARLSCFSR